MTTIAPIPSPWKVCDASALLRAGDYDTLDQLFDEALAASFHDRTSEERYYAALPADLKDCIDAGAEGLALLRAWQAARPESAHAWLCEAHYWFHWAYEYRGSGWSNTVTELGWTCAHACCTHAAVCAIQALERSPTLWSAPALLMQSVAAFEEPEWLSELVRSGRGPVGELAHDLALEGMPAEVRDELLAMLARSGIRVDERIACPQSAPESLPPPMQGKKLLSGRQYWMHATIHLHPRLFFFLRQCIWFMQPRWGGSHDRVRAFIASPTCAHLDEVEKDRLRHEIWRDDHLGNEVDEDDDLEDVRNWIAAAHKRAEEALYPYHRWETLYWISSAHYGRNDLPQALAYLKQAEAHWPIDDDEAMARAVLLCCKLEPQDPSWLGQAIVRSANAGESVAAMILHGYCTLKGLLGFVQNTAAAHAWFDAARRHAPGSLAWNKVAYAFRRGNREADAFELATMGLAAGGDSCDYLLGLFHEDGVHVAPDLGKAIHYYRQTAESGGNMGAYKLGYASYNLGQATKEPAERSRLLRQAVEAARQAHVMGHSEGLESMLMFIGALEDVPARHEYLELVREHAQQGDATAMATMSVLLADNDDKKLYDYRESVRWIMGAQAVAPESEYVQNVTKTCHQDGFLSSTLYKLTRRQIKAHEIPGADNAMV
ncbi:TPR repeat protein [Variovorax sp. SG517]|uniref:DUF4034 domain-containing protein n=1 Tax=Variovorax sp. SG517 TaxID=2587117 RepID=UPI00159DA54D|nr:DUF4034 domain-containing protein [Variovorax sp. SG517]NVM89744.1 TPR repeat protein [Variovorax sp. SG517]